MRALLLAAGKATRLGNLSKVSPKCLHEVGGVALLDHLVGQLIAAGVDEFLINAHHLADQVFEHVSAASWSDRATVVNEESLLGTLGTLRMNADFFQGQGGWVLHADNYLSASLTSVRDAFDARPDDVWGAMLTFEVDDPSSFGVVTVDTHGVVMCFQEKQAEAQSRSASAATYLFDDRVMDVVRRSHPEQTDISHDLIPQLMGRLVAVPAYGDVIDIGTPEGLELARTNAAKG
jgi:mannose-1-phosphate guanylyltransferase